ncbi:ribosome biogenesis GTP-binding protein YihA/YsxC [Eubacteriales bacterium KG127]
MKIKNSDIIAVAVKEEQYPQVGPIEVAFAGRSNVGKSSLLNLLTGRRKLAKISGSPGKTRTINFYSLNNDEIRIVDLPGYGYAKVSKTESEKWGEMMEVYLTTRESLVKVVQLVDIRHKPSVQDVQMYEFLKYYGLDGIVVATKADKISRNQYAKSEKLIRQTLGMDKSDIIYPISSLNKTGQQPLINALFALKKEDNEIIDKELERNNED